MRSVLDLPYLADFSREFSAMTAAAANGLLLQSIITNMLRRSGVRRGVRLIGRDVTASSQWTDSNRVSILHGASNSFFSHEVFS